MSGFHKFEKRRLVTEADGLREQPIVLRQIFLFGLFPRDPAASNECRATMNCSALSLPATNVIEFAYDTKFTEQIDFA